MKRKTLDPMQSDGALESPSKRSKLSEAGSGGGSSEDEVETPTPHWDLSKPFVPYEEAVRRVKAKRGDEPIRLYADGVFDLFHFGHARALEQAKKSFPNSYLIVGCCSDRLTHKFKGKTVMKDTERYESLRHCKWVDEVVTDAPWVLTPEFLDKHDIDFVCHDALPYGDASGASATSNDLYYPLKHLGKFCETQRTEGVSTTDLIMRIVRDYDMFIRRNMSRGYSGKEMNVSFVKEKAIRLDMAVEGIKKSLEGKTKAALDEAGQVLRKWGDKAEEIQGAFLTLFSSDGPLAKAVGDALTRSPRAEEEARAEADDA
jgi:choline-phosphate cytidylyltransferase